MAEERTLRPDFVLWVEQNDLTHWNIPEHIDNIESIETVWMFDRNVHVHCCEITASYECWPIETRAVLKDEFADDEDVRDAVDNMVTCNQDGEIKYVHVASMEQLMGSHPERFKVLGDTGLGVPYDETPYDEQQALTIEFCQCNQQI